MSPRPVLLIGAGNRANLFIRALTQDRPVGMARGRRPLSALAPSRAAPAGASPTPRVLLSVRARTLNP
jgi:hypothetical protein